MFRIVAILLGTAFAVGTVSADEIVGVLLKVDVKANKIVLIKLPKGKKTDLGEKVKALTEVKETTVRVAKDVKVFTPKDEKRITGGELVENPAGLKAIQYMRADPRSSSTYHYAQITIDEKTESVTAIRMIGTFWIERRMKPE